MEIELYKKLNETPAPLQAIDQMGKWFCRSGMFGCTKEEQGSMLALICVSENITPVQVKQKYHLMTNGNISMRSHRILADFKKLGGKFKWLKDGQDGRAARLQLTLDGNTVEYESTIEAATRNGYVKKDSAWDKRPGNMLRADCIRNGVPMLAPEIIGDDIDDDAAPAESVPPLFPSTATATVVTSSGGTVAPFRPEVKKETPPVTEAEIVPGPTAEKATQAEASIAASATAPATPHKVIVAEDGLLSPVTVTLFIGLCRERGDAFDEAVTKWLKARGWVKEDGVFPAALREIRMDRMQNVLNAFGEWAKVVEAADKAGAK